MGAWIETNNIFVPPVFVSSHPTWVRGLKHTIMIDPKVVNVAPYVGAWIETMQLSSVFVSACVAPYVGA